MRKTVVFAAITVGTAFWGTRTPVRASPPTNAEWGGYQGKIWDAEMQGDFAPAENASRQLHEHCRTAVGDEHPDTGVAAAAVQEYHKLRSFDEQTRRQIAMAMAACHRVWQETESIAEESLPSIGAITKLIAAFGTCTANIPPGLPSEVPLEADCAGGIARVLVIARTLASSEPFMVSAHEGYLSIEGLDTQTKNIGLAYAVLLRELDREPDRQVALLKDLADFMALHETTPRLAWRKERAMTQLAETYYRQGNHQKADRLYAEVRNRLPEESDHDLVGWCKSWCDRHEARQLMEKGDWDGAYEKILQARVGTIDYGHRNLSKGLTMERILRMSAEIQRKRANQKEADEDQEYADLIARHAAKLRTAVEAELKKLNESEANATPQPLPAPSP